MTAEVRDGAPRPVTSRLNLQFLAISSAVVGEGLVTQVVEVTTAFGDPLTSTATSLPWSVAEISQI